MNTSAALFRLSILSALGLSACAAGPFTSLDDESGDGGETSTETTYTPTDMPTIDPMIDPAECLDPVPILQAGTEVPSGFVTCADGFIHREAIVECVTGPPTGTCGGGNADWGCQSDDECVDGLNGVCNTDFAGGCYCQYGCNSDADCAAGTICACAGVVDTRNRCIVADCTATGGCSDGLCGLDRWEDVCGVPQARTGCTSEASTCRFDDECPTACEFEPQQLRCAADKGWQCQTEDDIWCGEYCGEGRPFIVDEQLRVAEPCRDDARMWSSLEPAPCPALPPDVAATLATHWTRVGLFEHASVASFARFTLELLALGAPPALLRASQRAAADEVHHAELAFALASRYAGAPLGPGPLAVADALDRPQLEQVTRALILEACIGETLAAIEAHHAAAVARDPQVRAALERIAADELRHAELGWACLRWLLDRHGAELCTFALRCLDVGLGAIDIEHGVDTPADAELCEAHGLLAPDRRNRVRADAIERVLAPCVDTLRSQLRAARPQPAPSRPPHRAA